MKNSHSNNLPNTDTLGHHAFLTTVHLDSQAQNYTAPSTNVATSSALPTIPSPTITHQISTYIQKSKAHHCSDDIIIHENNPPNFTNSILDNHTPDSLHEPVSPHSLPQQSISCSPPFFTTPHFPPKQMIRI